jgi:hypothetical protein
MPKLAEDVAKFKERRDLCIPLTPLPPLAGFFTTKGPFAKLA